MAARKRKRNYRAEYARRTKGTRAGSAARQKARGHAPPAGRTEYGVRKERVVRRHGAGVTPTALRNLRRDTLQHMLRELQAAGAKKRINETAVAARLRTLRASSLRHISMMDGGTLRMLAGKSPGEVHAILNSPLMPPRGGIRGVSDDDFEAYDGPDIEDGDYDEDEGVNPLWYG